MTMVQQQRESVESYILRFRAIVKQLDCLGEKPAEVTSARRFLTGLRPEIKLRIMGRPEANLEEAFEAAKGALRSMAMMGEGQQSFQTHAPQQYFQQNNPQQQSSSYRQPPTPRLLLKDRGKN